ncbi:MAG: hypothetical protein MMC33_004331 [Icmadophila ericetorum]|nr:hypothetical protein [Icmadophila ericetorum]
MEQRRTPEYTIEVFGDPTSIREIVKGRILSQILKQRLRVAYLLGILHTIFFHRYFPTLRPSTVEVLDLTLPFVADQDLETLIETKVGQLFRQLTATNSPTSSVRGQLGVQYFEKKRRKAGGLGWFGGGKLEEEVCWEVWRLEVTLATPKTESGLSTRKQPRGETLWLIITLQNGKK